MHRLPFSQMGVSRSRRSHLERRIGLFEKEAGVEDGEGIHCHNTHTIDNLKSTTTPARCPIARNGNLHAIQGDKRNLVLHNWIPPPTRHFRDSIDAPDEDSRVRKCDSRKEALEASRMPQGTRRRVQVLSELPDADEDVHSQEPEDGQRDHLRHDANHYDVVSGCGV